MAGNSQRRGATTKGKGRTAGSGGRVRRGLEGKGPTPKAEDRPYHKAYKAKQAAARRASGRQQRPGQGGKGRPGSGPEWVAGRNPVLEALHAGLPVKTAYIADGAERDDRLRDILKFAAEHTIPMVQVHRFELDRLTGGALHQGVALQLPAFEYAHPDDVLADAIDDEDSEALVVFLDQITDPRNLGAVIRSAAAFGAHGVVIPERRSAGMTAAAWKTSAGAAARIPVAMATNLNRALESYAKAGFTIVGLAGEGDVDVAGIPGVDGPLVVVIGSEGEGLSRLVREHCDHLVSIPINSDVESLNASVAASIALYEINRCR
ncbi:23S rRNA (guanosine(2251)-2'-O)-methyltransferase RlmB [Aestuariimicrobium sp. Y1814]|uniref:23S rRNA (guanosine(2251)-2'-O)-methyltransferase RlmB n=1 Tax=Aestuariimicrobium sp. Y1814 TaxID=3418742 RepID=UPI003DA79477